MTTSPPAVVRFPSTQDTAVTSGTMAAAGSRKTRRRVAALLALLVDSGPAARVRTHPLRVASSGPPDGVRGRGCATRHRGRPGIAGPADAARRLAAQPLVSVSIRAM